MALLVTWRAGVAAAFMHGLLVTQCLAAGPGRGGRGSHKGGLRLPRGGAQSLGPAALPTREGFLAAQQATWRGCPCSWDHVKGPPGLPGVPGASLPACRIAQPIALGPLRPSCRV